MYSQSAFHMTDIGRLGVILCTGIYGFYIFPRIPSSPAFPCRSGPPTALFVVLPPHLRLFRTCLGLLIVIPSFSFSLYSLPLTTTLFQFYSLMLLI